MVDLTKAKGGFLGNIYGKHDGYDGSVYAPKSLGKAVVAQRGGDRVCAHREEAAEDMTKLFIPAQTDRDRGGILVSSDEMKLKNIGNHLCSTILSRYWKGIEGNSSQMVVEVRKCES